MSDAFTAAPAILGANGEAMVSWFMERYDLLSDDEKVQAGNRDVAIGSLVMFTNGFGQPSTELFSMFPELASLYYIALKNRRPKVSGSEDTAV